MEDFVRFAQPGIIACIGGIFTVLLLMFVINAIIRKADPENSKEIIKCITWISVVIIIILAAVFFGQLIHAASVNVIPKSTIDPNTVDFDRYKN